MSLPRPEGIPAPESAVGIRMENQAAQDFDRLTREMDPEDLFNEDPEEIYKRAWFDRVAREYSERPSARDAAIGE